MIHVSRPHQPYTKICRRYWKHFSLEMSTKQIELSLLFQPVDPSRTAIEIVLCHQLVVTTILDDFAPVTEVCVCPCLHRPFLMLSVGRPADEPAGSRGLIVPDEVLVMKRSSWRLALKVSRHFVREKGRQYWQRVLDSSHSWH